MIGDQDRQNLEIVASLEHRDDFSPGEGAHQVEDGVVDELIALRAQIGAGHQIVFMGVESGREQDRIGVELAEGRNQIVEQLVPVLFISAAVLNG